MSKFIFFPQKVVRYIKSIKIPYIDSRITELDRSIRGIKSKITELRRIAPNDIFDRYKRLKNNQGNSKQISDLEAEISEHDDLINALKLSRRGYE